MLAYTSSRQSFETLMHFSHIIYSQNESLNSPGALADQSLMVLTQLFLYPGIGLSYGIA